jgi:hypothetical protein
VPIHSFAPYRFREFFDNVEVLNDREWWDVSLPGHQRRKHLETKSFSGPSGCPWSVMLAPGSAFGYEHHMRLGIGQRPDIFAAGLERVGDCFAQLRASHHKRRTSR